MPTCGNQKTNILNRTPPGPRVARVDSPDVFQLQRMYTSNYDSKRQQKSTWFQRDEREERIDPKNVYVIYNHKTKSAATEP